MSIDKKSLEIQVIWTIIMNDAEIIIFRPFKILNGFNTVYYSFTYNRVPFQCVFVTVFDFDIYLLGTMIIKVFINLLK